MEGVVCCVGALAAAFVEGGGGWFCFCGGVEELDGGVPVAAAAAIGFADDGDDLVCFCCHAGAEEECSERESGFGEEACHTSPLWEASFIYFSVRDYGRIVTTAF